MDTSTNTLDASAFVSNPRVFIEVWPSPLIEVHSQTGPTVQFSVHRPVKTPHFPKAESTTVFIITKDSKIRGWHLKSVLLAQIQPTSRRGWVATTWLEGVAEYGVAKSASEAVEDLVISIGEYLESLENRVENLGDSAKRELDYLRKLIERSKDG